jgi:predicted aspartyl protease
MKVTLRAVALACVLIVTVARADTTSQDLIKAIDTWDVHALQAVATQTSDLKRQALARAVLQAFAGQDDAAIDSLDELIAAPPLDDELRFVAFHELGMLHQRNQRHAESARAFESALALAPAVRPDQTDDLEDDVRYAHAAAAFPPMTVAIQNVDAPPIAIKRDSLDLSRVSATINRQRVDAVLDTAASSSVASESTAKRLHLRMLRFEGGGVLAGATDRVSSRFAIADTLVFAGREFHNVPFVVLPDEAVSLSLEGGVTGKTEPIIGLPVLRKLGRIEIAQRDGQETLRVSSRNVTASAAGGRAPPVAPAHLLLPDAMPIVLVRVDPQGAELRMSLDTGANRTALAPAALSALPALASDAAQGRTGEAHAGGSSSNEAGTIIPQLTLRVGDAAIPLSRVPVTPGPANCEGTLGQDVFRSGGGYVIDFDRMTLEILPAPGAP